MSTTISPLSTNDWKLATQIGQILRDHDQKPTTIHFKDIDGRNIPDSLILAAEFSYDLLNEVTWAGIKRSIIELSRSVPILIVSGENPINVDWEGANISQISYKCYKEEPDGIHEVEQFKERFKVFEGAITNFAQQCRVGEKLAV